MKALLIALIALISFEQNSECGDGITYSNKEQTKLDKRLADYTKIKGIPTFNEGNDKLNRIIEDNLTVAPEGKEMVFRLNYIFTITCDGQITDFKSLGDSKLAGLTNIQEIIEGTKGMWTPAEKAGKPVDCIYFAKKTVLGNKY